MTTEDFDGADLADDRWVPHYLPHWSSRSASLASYDVASSVLRLHVPVGQGPWCPDRHSPGLRVSAIASGLYAGPLGSTVGQQPFSDGLTVTEEQPRFEGWLVSVGRVTVRARADLTARSMVSVWMTGFEDAPDRCGEVCVFEVFGDTVTSSSAGVGAGVHAFRDPALTEDFSVTPVDLDLREWHEYAVSMTPTGCTWTVDDVPLRTSAECPAYPLQLFVGVFDFPDREDGTTREHEPSFEVDWIRHEPLEAL